MDLLPTPEQDEIVSSIRAVLADRHTLGQPATEDLWETAAAQGWFGLGVAESDGGVGYTAVEEALLFIEIGRAGVPGPFLGTALAAHLDPSFASGSTRVSLAQRDGDRVLVFDAEGATHAILLDDFSLVTVAALEPEPSLDTLVPIATTAEVTPLATGGDGRLFSLLLAAELAGIAAATTEQSVAYGVDRQQFGQPIGGFQAVKHRCADMAVRSEAALTQVHYASLSLANGTGDSTFQTEAAVVVAIRAALDNAEINVQNHGGIGFTWEHTAHRYVTRARVLGALGGGVRRHLADLLAQPAAG
jgi:alkylation response protein AidB-like acyl-CoA dehydrogenase